MMMPHALMACSTMSTNSPHDQLCTHKSCSISKYTVVWGPRWYHMFQIFRTWIDHALSPWPPVEPLTAHFLLSPCPIAAIYLDGEVCTYLPAKGEWQQSAGPPEGPKWVGPRWAQVGGPKLGPSQKFGTQTNPKNNNSQNQNPCRPKCRQGLDW